MSRESGFWLYAVTDSPPDMWAGLSGVAGEPVQAVQCRGLGCVTSRVPLAEFGEEALRRNLEDLDWLTVTARAHNAVIGAVARVGAVVPLRLATVYIDDERLHGMLEDRQAELTAALDRLRDRTEWGVKAYRIPVGRSEPEAGRPETGTEYLHRRRAALSASRAEDTSMHRLAWDLHGDLAALAVDSRRHPPQDPTLTGRREVMALNGSYLVEDRRAGEFTDAVAALDDTTPGLLLELTGPWPPYSFASEEGEP